MHPDARILQVRYHFGDGESQETVSSDFLFGSPPSPIVDLDGGNTTPGGSPRELGSPFSPDEEHLGLGEDISLPIFSPNVSLETDVLEVSELSSSEWISVPWLQCDYCDQWHTVPHEMVNEFGGEAYFQCADIGQECMYIDCTCEGGCSCA